MQKTLTEKVDKNPTQITVGGWVIKTLRNNQKEILEIKNTVTGIEKQ